MPDVETTWDGLPVARERPHVCCIVVWRTVGHPREFLVLHRLATGGPGFNGDWAWTPPSGARQPGERPDAAAARELREETGFSVPIQPVPDSPSDDVALYVAEAPHDANVALGLEHDEFAWLLLADAVTRCMPHEVGACLTYEARWLDDSQYQVPR